MVLTLKLTLILGFEKQQIASKTLLTVIRQYLMPKYLRKLLPLFKSNGKSRYLKIVRSVTQCDSKHSQCDPYCKDFKWLYANADSYFGQKLNC